jgi:hypothetical protein
MGRRRFFRYFIASSLKKLATLATWTNTIWRDILCHVLGGLIVVV